jgi:hypothetical protein
MCCNRNRECGCINDCDFTEENGGCRPPKRKTYHCQPTHQVIKHRHIVKHRHDVVNEYDVVHEHDYYYRNVVSSSEVERHHGRTPYNPDYCEGDDCDFLDSDDVNDEDLDEFDEELEC